MGIDEATRIVPASKTVLGKKCWTPAEAASAIGMHRNTVLNWARRTRNGELNMPMIGGVKRGSKVYIPIEDFVNWYEYA